MTHADDVAEIQQAARSFEQSVRRVPCPDCGAAPGRGCKVPPDGVFSPHAERITAAGYVLSRPLGWDDLTAVEEMLGAMREFGGSEEAPFEFEGMRVITGCRDAVSGYSRFVGEPITE